MTDDPRDPTDLDIPITWQDVAEWSVLAVFLIGSVALIALAVLDVIGQLQAAAH